MTRTIAELVDAQRIVVCIGSGGVGKTTVAAALALYGAMKGRRAMVLTIDPARRLAQSLGLDTLKSGGQRIPEAALQQAGIRLAGELSAGMLDQKSAWDDFIGRHAPSAEVRSTILRNEFYQHLSQSFSGSIEYMAIEELGRIDESRLYDLIVLDTPPTAHALDFLDAPRRLEDFFDRSVVGWLLKPYVATGWVAWKAASRTLQFLFERIEDATGIQTLGEVSAFFIAMEKMFDGITARSRSVRALLRDPATAFVLVAGPEEQGLGEAEDLAAKVRDLGITLRGVVMNRVHPLPPRSAAQGGIAASAAASAAHVLEALRARGVSEEILRWLEETYVGASVTACVEAVRREAFEVGFGQDVIGAAVPEMTRDVHDLASLAAVVEHLRQAPR